MALAIGLAAGVAGSPLGPLGSVGAEEPMPSTDAGPGAQETLEASLLAAVRDAGFGDIVDFGPVEDRCPGGEGCPQPAPPPAHLPNVDLAVIELDEDGKAVAAANVLLSRDHPEGIAVPIDLAGGPAGSYGVSDVRWRRWDIDRANGGTFDEATGEQLTTKGWADNPERTAADDILAGRDDAELEFMSPYPASVFKLMVAFRIMRLIDMGELTFDQVVVPEEPTAPEAPPEGEGDDAPDAPDDPDGTDDPDAPDAPDSPDAPGDADDADGTDDAAGNDGSDDGDDADEGDGTDKSDATDSSDGTDGSGDSGLQAAAVDRARGSGPLSAAMARSGGTVADLLGAMITYSDNAATRSLIKLLWDMGDLPKMHAELRSLGLGTLQLNGTDPETGGNWQPGQIHMTAMDTARLLWLIDGGDGKLWDRPDGEPVESSILSESARGHLKGLLAQQAYHEALSTGNLCGAPNVVPGIPARVAERWIQPDGRVVADGYDYGQDVRPCNAEAEVIFAHKTGTTYNYGSNAGIVQSLPGRPQRHYVIAFLSSLGYRYADTVFADADSNPCYAAVGPICYVQRIPAMAAQIDRALVERAAAREASTA